MTLDCTELGSPGKGPAKFAYEGADAGTLTIKGPFGEIALPARREVKKGAYGLENQTATIIHGAANVDALMPDRKAVEDCFASKDNPENDADIAFVNMMACQSSTPNGAAPIPIAASATITELKVDQETMLEVILNRTYPGAPGADGKPMQIQAFFRCEAASDSKP